MADSEIGETEETSLDLDEASEEKPGFLKSKLFLIIVAVTLVLLLAGGAYFFFASSDKEELEIPPSESSTEQNEEEPSSELIEDSDIDEDDSRPMAEQLGFEEPAIDESSAVDPEQENNTSIVDNSNSETPIDAQQENQQMKQKIADLEAQISKIEKAIQGQTNIENDQTIPAPSQDSLVRYPQDYRASSTLAVPDQSPPPKPSWGEFDRLKK